MFTKKITLDCYTWLEGNAMTCPIQRGVKFYPDWWTSAPKSYWKTPLIEEPTVRTCVGVQRYFTNSFVMPLWSDLNIIVGPKADPTVQWQFADNQSLAFVIDERKRVGLWPDHEYAHLTIQAPWRFVCSHDIPWVYEHAMWHSTSPESLLVGPGVAGFKYQHHAHINTVMPRGAEPRMIQLRAATPLMHLIPLTEREVEIRVHQVSYSDLERVAPSQNVTFLNRYLFSKRARQANGCPMHSE
jgi:hypothetical protein